MKPSFATLVVRSLGCLVVASAVVIPARAQVPTLVQNLNPNNQTYSGQTFHDWGGRAVFTSISAADGVELYVSDGTTAGTHMLRDIRPGPGDAMPFAPFYELEWHGIHYFRADDGVNGAEMWQSDGTTAGTNLFIDFMPGSVGSNPEFFPWFGQLLILATTPTYGREFWLSDGTVAGTHLMVDVNPGPADGVVVYRPLGNRLFFWGNDGVHGVEPWVTDGTVVGTSMMFDCAPGAASSISFSPNFGLREFRNSILFQANDGVHGLEPWVTDGTAAGTSMLMDIRPGPGDSLAMGTAAETLGHLLLFNANDGTHGAELWITDGTTAGTSFVKDIYPGLIGSAPQFTSSPITYGVIFNAASPTEGTEPWISDGTAAGTHIVSDFAPGPQTSTATVTPISPSSTLILAPTPATGREPWIMDGATGALTLVELNPGPGDGAVSQGPMRLNGRVLFDAYTPGTGWGIGVSDGTVAGTGLTGVASGGSPSWIPNQLVSCGDEFYILSNFTGAYLTSMYTNGAPGASQLFRGSGGQAAPLQITAANRIGRTIYMAAFDTITSLPGLYAMTVDNDNDGVIEYFDDLSFASGCNCTAAVAPCGNSSPTTGCTNSTGLGAKIDASGTTILSQDNLVLTISQLPPSTLGILFMSATLNSPVPFRDGARCVTGSVARWPVHAANPAGVMTYGPGMASQAAALFAPAFRFLPASTRNFQAWYRDNGGPCGSGSNLSSSGSAVFRP